MPPFPHHREEGPPPHIQSRDRAFTELSRLLSTSSDLMPPALPYHTGYTQAVERDCVREICGMCQNWRSPRAADWRIFPEEDAELKKEQHDVLIARIYHDRAFPGPPSTGNRIHTEFLVLHSGEDDIHSAAWPVASGHQPQLRTALNFVPQNVKTDLVRDSRGNDFYVELGYVGDLVHCMAAARLLSGIPEYLSGGSIRSAQWRHPEEITEILSGGSLVNEAQRRALAGLSREVELIRGPPGTGKSHTVATLAKHSVPLDEAVIITAVQNRAVEATVDKFHSEGVPFVTFGPRLSGISQRYTLTEQVKHHPLVVAPRMHLQRMQNMQLMVKTGLSKLRGAIYQPMQPGERSHRQQARDEYIRRLCHAPSDELQATAEYRDWLQQRNRVSRAAGRGRGRGRHDHRLVELVTAFVCRSDPWAKLAAAVVRHRYAAATELLDYLSAAVETAKYYLIKEEKRAKAEIVRQARALLCTTASVGVAIRANELGPLTCRIKTVVVDEAGTVADRHLLPIMAVCSVKRWVFVGDTKQLPVFTHVRGQTAQSTMERLELQGIPTALLSIQYRMPQAVCNIVSRCFYDEQLVSAEQQPHGRQSIRFESVCGRAEKEFNGTSMVNHMEIEKVITIVKERLPLLTIVHTDQSPVGASTDAAAVAATVHQQQLASPPQPRIAVITTYAAQVRALEARLVEEGLEHRQRVQPGNQDPGKISANTVEVITIDGAQGREWEHVIISTVSSEPNRARFIKDPRRLCVALSRCKQSIALVAHPNLVLAIPALAAVQAATHGDDTHVASLTGAMGSLAVSSNPSGSAAVSADRSADDGALPAAASWDRSDAWSALLRSFVAGVGRHDGW
eukprot:COSAG01_NODE_6301_length_3747_cov_6.773849_1_plen_850_part_00